MIRETTVMFPRKCPSLKLQCVERGLKGQDRQGHSSPGAGQVVLRWYFLAGSWLYWGSNEAGLVFLPLFIRLSSIPSEAYLGLQDISFSSGEHTEPKGFLTQLLPVHQFQFTAS